MGDLNNGGGCMCVASEHTQKISEPPTQFCCEPKTALKYKLGSSCCGSLGYELRWLSRESALHFSS